MSSMWRSITECVLLGVVVDGDVVTGGAGLAGQGVAASGLVGVQCVVLVHRELTRDDLRAAGAADAAGAGEGDVRARAQGGVEDRLVRGDRGLGGTGQTVQLEGDGDVL